MAHGEGPLISVVRIIKYSYPFSKIDMPFLFDKLLNISYM